MRAPDFWSHDTIAARLLAPFGHAYAMATRHRLTRPPEYRAPIPVICIGNLTAGGSGKTPVVQALAKRAIARGIAVQCLSRGYGGSLAGPLRVDPAIHSAADVGDEPLLLARIAPTWIARDRAAGARAAVAAGAQLLILDDGLQNPSLAYDLSVMVIDGGFGFGNGRCIPAGPLREPVDTAANRVSAAILIGQDTKGSIAFLPPALPVIRARIVPRENDLAGKNIIAFAGLGRPEKFRETLENLGAIITGWFSFPDHHNFTSDDLMHLRQAAKAAQARLVTTEKDYIRLPDDFRAQVTVLAIDLVPDDRTSWDDLLGTILP